MIWSGTLPFLTTSPRNGSISPATRCWLRTMRHLNYAFLTRRLGAPSPDSEWETPACALLPWRVNWSPDSNVTGLTLSPIISVSRLPRAIARAATLSLPHRYSSDFWKNWTNLGLKILERLDASG